MQYLLNQGADASHDTRRVTLRRTKTGGEPGNQHLDGPGSTRAVRIARSSICRFCRLSRLDLEMTFTRSNWWLAGLRPQIKKEYRRVFVLRLAFLPWRPEQRYQQELLPGPLGKGLAPATGLELRTDEQVRPRRFRE